MNSANEAMRGDSQQGNSTGKGQSDARAQYGELVKSRALENKAHMQILGDFETYLDLRAKIAEKSRIAEIQAELAAAETTAERKSQLIIELAEEEALVTRRSLDATLAAHQNMYKNASAAQKAEISKRNAENIRLTREAALEEYDTKIALAYDNADLQKKLEQERAEFVRASQKEEAAAFDQHMKLQKSASLKQYNQVKESLSELREQPTIKGAVKLAVDMASVNLKDLQALQKSTSENLKDQQEETKRRQEYLEQLANEGVSEDDPKYKEAQDAIIASKLQENIATMQKAMVDAVSSVKDAFNKSFDQAEERLSSYMGTIDARLQGSGKTYNKISDLISTNLSLSPFVKTQDVLDNFKELSDKGVAYNIEQRAFLQTISDKIANTFDVFDSNLLRLVRLQQADTTAARLGMEAALTRTLNSMFKDTSYLSDVYDTISAAIIDANSSMTHEAAAEFEFVIQKWLGALSSLGMSSETLTQIATGINYLATGDVQSLSNNTQLQTLMAMSASYAGISYSDMLVEGIDASTTNKLMESMVTYLKTIAENSDNQVVRSAYGDVFNLSMSDMRAISNLTASEISTLSSTNLSYSGMNAELSNQLSQVITRTSLTEMMKNLYNNAVYGVAEDLVSNPVTYSMVKFLRFMEEQNLDINIPFVNAMGFGIDLNTSVQDLLNLGVGLSSAFSLMGNILGGLGSVGGMNLNSWNATTYNQRGGSMSFVTSSLSGGTSGSTFISNGSSSDMEKSAISSGTDDAEEKSKIINKNNKSEYTFDDFFKAVIMGSENNNWLRVEEKLIKEVYQNTSSSFLHVQDARMVFDNGSLQVVDTKQQYNNGDLKVHDTTLFSRIDTLFGSSSLLNNGDVRVYDTRVEKSLRSILTASYISSNVYTGVSSALSAYGRGKLNVTTSDFEKALNSYGSKGVLKVNDSSMGSSMSSLFGTLTTAVKSSNKDVTVIRPADNFKSGESMNVHITNASDVRSQNTVNLASGTTITIDEDTLISAFRKALNEKETGKSVPYTLQDMVKALIDGTAKIQVTNTVGASLDNISASAERMLEDIVG